MVRCKDAAILLTPVIPRKNSSGRALRAWGWLLELNCHHDVYVVVTGRLEAEDIPPNYPAAGIFNVSNEIFLSNRFLRIIGVFFPPTCLFFRNLVIDWLQPKPNVLLRGLAEQLGGKHIKRIIIFRFYLHELGHSISSLGTEARIDLDMDDLESKTRLSVARCLARMGRVRESIISLMAAAQYYLLERFIVKGHHAIWLAATEDAQILTRTGIPNVGTRPNKIERPAQIRQKYFNHTATARFLFVGSLDYPPNQEAVLFILNKIQPELEKCLSTRWTFRVVGRNSPKKLASLIESSERVEFYPDADQLTEHYQNSTLVIVPLWAGGGSKTKTIEAFSHRRPVVSSHEGVRGLSVKSGIHYLQAQTGFEFAQAIARITLDLSLADKISRAGEEHFYQQHLLS